MKKFLKWFLFFLGLAIILGTLIFGSSMEKTVPEGVDLGLEIYYFFAFIVGGLLVYLSTRVTISNNKTT